MIKKDILKLQKVMQMMTIDSLDKPVVTDKDGVVSLTLQDTVQDEGPTPDDILIQAELYENVKKAIDALPAAQSKIMRMRFGFDGKPPMTLEEVGQEFGVSRSRIQQLETKAFHKLRWILLNKFKITKEDI